MITEPIVTRDDILLESLVLVDGQAGCGKTLFTAIVAAMDRVELLNYSPELENICALKYLDKIQTDAAETMIRIQMDLILYETMMSRRTNFRPSDLSGTFRDVDFLTYVKRLFSKGNEIIPKRIKEEKPILHFATHNLLAFSEPVFTALGKKAVLIEIVRHPLYMLIQHTLNQINFSKPAGTARQFHIYIKHKGKQLPYWHLGQEELDLRSNSVERAIYDIQKHSELTKSFKEKFMKKYGGQIVTIPFERFVLDPWPYMRRIEDLLATKVTSKTRKVMRKHNIPRKKIADGIPLAIYKRCGWKPPEKGLSEKQELEKRRQYAIEQGAGKEALEVLDRISAEYEQNYLKLHSEIHLETSD
jgi:hypothetical protein